MLDESADDEELIQRLRRKGIQVVSPRAVGLKGEKDDERYLNIAAQNGWILLTKNPRDFRRLHERWMRQGKHHAGILAIYSENNPAKDMKVAEVVRAVERLLSAGIDLADEFHVLNAWR